MSFDRFEWMNAWVDDPSVPAEVMATLVCVMRHINGNGLAYPAVSTLATYLGKSERQVQRYLRAAADVGYLEVVPRPGMSNYFKARMPAERGDTHVGGDVHDGGSRGDTHVGGDTGVRGKGVTPVSGVTPMSGEGCHPCQGGGDTHVTLTDQLTDHRTDHAAAAAARATEEASNVVELPVPVMPPEITGQREEWVPRIQAWVMDMFQTEGMGCSIPDAGAIAKRIALSELTHEEYFRYLSDDIPQKAARVKEGKLQAAVALRYLGTAQDVARWKAGINKHKQTDKTTPVGKRTYVSEHKWGTPELRKAWGLE